MVRHLCHQKRFADFRRPGKDVNARIEQVFNDRRLLLENAIHQIFHRYGVKIGRVLHTVQLAEKFLIVLFFGIAFCLRFWYSCIGTFIV